MNKKRIKEIKEQIIKSLEEETHYCETIKGLVSTFYSLAIMGIGINLALKSIKKIK